MDQKSRDLGKLVREFGLTEAMSHKFLEMRDKYPLLNEILARYFIIGHVDSSALSQSYSASWDEQGRLIDFDSNPPVIGLDNKKQPEPPIRFAQAVAELLYSR
ncbi:MAG TPA: hypothetical protein VJI97_01150 [Candidatus Nanoarchaeia archaeon]|nr:hypothetical protein [Candidatus Nanoarchaeia archaeon]